MCAGALSKAAEEIEVPQWAQSEAAPGQWCSHLDQRGDAPRPHPLPQTPRLRPEGVPRHPKGPDDPRRLHSGHPLGRKTVKVLHLEPRELAEAPQHAASIAVSQGGVRNAQLPQPG